MKYAFRKPALAIAKKELTAFRQTKRLPVATDIYLAKAFLIPSPTPMAEQVAIV